MSDADANNRKIDFSYGWQPEDFSDMSQVSLVEDDPWADDASADESMNINETVMPESYSSFREESLVNEDDELDIYGYVDAFGEDEWDEPEPFAEYDSDLKETLYVLDGEFSDISRNLRIDEFIAGVELCSDTQREQIVELLESLSVGRMRSWFPWLQGQDWSGHSLLLFLDFRLNHWEENPQWWEYNFWYSRLGHWWTYPESNYGVLSLDATYALVHARLRCSSDEIVDEAWLKEWEEFALWKHGFPSFASFAVFRAGTVEEEDWRELLLLNPEFGAEGQSTLPLYALSDGGNGDVEALMVSLDGRYSIWEDYLPYRNSRRSQLWFAMQDEYDPAEWHDNLGWPHDWIEATHPYLLSDSSNDLSGPYTDAPYAKGTRE